MACAPFNPAPIWSGRPPVQFSVRSLVLLFLAALSVRLAAVLVWESWFGPRLVFGDSESYWHLARCLARGLPYQYGEYGTVFRMPGYPLLLAPLFWLSDSPPFWAARLQGALFGAVAVAIIAIWAGRLLGRDVGLVAGWAATFHPELIAGSVPVLSETAFLPIWVIHLMCLTGWIDRSNSQPRTWPALGVGITAGLATLVRPSALLWLPFVAGATFVLGGLRKSRIGDWLWIGCGFVVIMAPWWARNYWVTGTVVLTTTQVGPSLYDGLNPRADGSSNMEFVAEKLAKIRRDHRNADSIKIELELDRRLKKEAFDWLLTNPLEAGKLALIKLGRFWNILPNDPGFNVFPVNVVIALGAFTTFLLAALGGWRFRDRPAVMVGCLLPAVYYSALHMIFVSSIRYRIPVVPGLIVLGSAALVGTFFPRVWAQQPRRENQQEFSAMFMGKSQKGQLETVGDGG